MHVPVRIKVSADRLLEGKLMISPRDGYAVTRDVEVPGGSVKTFTELTPSGEGSVAVRLLDEDGRTVARRDVTLQAGTDTELVGLLPHVLGTRPLPGVVPLAVDVGTARFVRLRPELLDRAPIGLFSLGTIGATPDDLDDLTASRLEGLARWVNHGGRLLVDAPRGTSLRWFPEEWQPAPDGRAFAGTGEIVLTKDALRSGRLSRLIEPTTRLPGHGLVSGSSWGDSPYAAVAAEANLPSPPLNGLLALGVLYAALAGPVLWFVLRRMKRELAMWTVLPSVAVTLTAAGWAGATFTGSDIAAAHQTRIETAAAGGLTDLYTGVRKRNGGEVTVALADALWAVAGATQGRGERTLRIHSAEAGPRTVVPLNPREVALMAGPGRSPTGMRLAVTAEARDGKVAGTVHNQTPYELRESAVIVGTNAQHVGRLRPGQRKKFSVATEPDLSDATVGSRLWSTGPPSTIGWNLWASAADTSFDYAATGSALAVGFTREHRVRSVVDGENRSLAGNAMITGRSPVRAVRGPVPESAVHVEQVRGPRPDMPLPGLSTTHSPAGTAPLVLRVTLPEGRTPAAVELRGPNTLTELDVWRDGAWQKILDKQPATTMTPMRGRSTYALGPLSGRVLYVRALEDPSFTDVASAPWYTVRESKAVPEAQ